MILRRLLLLGEVCLVWLILSVDQICFLVGHLHQVESAIESQVLGSLTVSTELSIGSISSL